MKAHPAHLAARPTAEASALPGEDIARYLELFASQVALAVRESDQPVAALAECMLAVSSAASEILASLRHAPGALAPAARASIEHQCVALRERIQLAVVAFQFHDLLTQRLQHVGGGLVELAETLKAPGRRHDAESWRSVGERIRGRYSLHEQRSLFDGFVNGITAPSEGSTGTAPGDRPSVELF